MQEKLLLNRRHEEKIEQVRDLLMKVKKDSIHSLELVDTVQRLSLCHHFEDEIKEMKIKNWGRLMVKKRRFGKIGRISKEWSDKQWSTVGDISRFLPHSITKLLDDLNSSQPRARRSSKLPPGPYQYPIIGNILDLGSQPHRPLAKLSTKYGPVMSLNLGSITTIVISSPEAAKIVLQKHDSTFSSRTAPSAVTTLKHNEFSPVWLPAGNQWKRLRKLCREQIFSIPKLDAREGLRREILQKLCDYVNECSETGRAVNIGDAAFTASLNMISSSLLSEVEFAQFGSDLSQEMKDLVWGVMKLFGSPNLADYFPVLKSADPQGILKQSKICLEKLLAKFDGIIDERLKSRGEKDDLVEAMIDLSQGDEVEFTRKQIIHLLLDLFVAGTDTTSGTVEWAMTELIRNPSKMCLLRNDIKNFIQENGPVEESDITRLPYLQAVVKETFRLHPVGPFLVPHKANSDVDIHGYVIPKNAQILVNVWASGRDPRIWANADEFVPERFLTKIASRVDFRGQDFELIPFGAGRRICPGLPLADRVVHQMLVTFVGNFEWKLLETIQGQEMDMNEKLGITLQKAVPLKVIPTKLRVTI